MAAWEMARTSPRSDGESAGVGGIGGQPLDPLVQREPAADDILDQADGEAAGGEPVGAQPQGPPRCGAPS